MNVRRLRCLRPQLRLLYPVLQMDHNWKGKIADFGLSHVKKRKVSHPFNLVTGSSVGFDSSVMLLLLPICSI